MVLGRLSLPIPEELLAQSTLRRSSSEHVSGRVEAQKTNPHGRELSQLLTEFEFHSQRASEAARRIQALLQPPTAAVENAFHGMHSPKVPAPDPHHHDVVSISKAFARKPRSLAPISGDLFAATALDCSLALWSCTQQRKLKQVELDGGVHAECMASTADHLLLVTAPEDSACSILRYSTTSLVCESVLANTKHSKQINCIQVLPSDASIFCTGSDDHLVVIHGAADVAVLNHHTAAVHSLAFVDTKLYSAGNDGRLNCIDTTSGRLVDACRTRGSRLAHISSWQSSPAYPSLHPSLLVAAQQSGAHDQFKLFDSRTSLNQCTGQFGWAESANTSRFLKFALQPNGHRLVCGTQYPADGVSRLNVWDLRRPERPSLTSNGSFGNRRWLECCFLDGRRAVASATDRSLSFLDIV